MNPSSEMTGGDTPGGDTRTTGLRRLGADFWAWRAAQQPRSMDDIPRIDRPAGWLPDVTAVAVARHRSDLARFEERHAALDPRAATRDPGVPDPALRADVVDHRLLGSALARVRWELDVVRAWQRQPSFYVDQSLGSVFDLLTTAGVDAARLVDVARLLAATPAILAAGSENLAGHAVREFAALTVDSLATIEGDVAAVVDALVALRPDGDGWADTADAVDTSDTADTADADRADRVDAAVLREAGRSAGAALAAFRDDLAAQLPNLAPATPVGPESFGWFLREVALLPYSPSQLLDIGRREADRAVTLELLERARNGTATRQRPEPRFATSAEQEAAQAAAELAVRRFYVERGLLSQPESLRHYRTHPCPAYLAPIGWLGTADDLTGPQRLDEDGGAYFPPPAPDLPYFYAANAHDPRAGIIHEGTHYQQLALAWRHPRPVRRHYYDSTANEGIAFYNEELMLASGLFDDAPRTREVVYNFMRLRALRVVVDVRLALGELDIDGAAEILQTQVPMDRETARAEAAFFAATPGQAMTYQVGKVQILSLLADAALAQGDSFSLQAFHDRLWLEGNVPIALQRYELLGDSSELDRLDALR